MAGIYQLDMTLKDILEASGVDTERVFRKAGIPMDFGSEGYSLNRDQYIALMNVLDEVFDGKSLLTYTDISSIITFSPPLFAGLCASDGEECIGRVRHYKRLIGPFILNVERASDTVTIECTFDDDTIPLPRFTQMSENLIIIHLLRSGTGLRTRPIRVTSPYRFEQEVIDDIGVTPEFSDKNVLTFSLEDMKEPFLSRNNVMWNYLEPELQRRYEEMEIDRSTAARVRTLLFEAVPAGNGNIDHVSREMAVSSRSLQRRLKEEDTTFLKQLNHIKELLAKNYLRNDRISTDEVAFLLGYSEVYPFMRAFKQWTGMTVGQYRETATALT